MFDNSVSNYIGKQKDEAREVLVTKRNEHAKNVDNLLKASELSEEWKIYIQRELLLERAQSKRIREYDLIKKRGKK